MILGTGSITRRLWQKVPCTTDVIAPLSGALLLWAGAAHDANATEALNPSVLYLKNCSVCHGDKGDGASHARQGLVPPPRDFTAAGMAESLTRERMINAVRNGRPGTAMVAWKDRLSNAEIEAIVDYIRSTLMGLSSKTAEPRSDTVDGAKIYARTCSVCHGDRGQSAQWAGSALKPPPRDFTTEQARATLSRERMIAAVAHGRPGTAMAAFASQLSRQEIEAVVDHIRTEFMGVSDTAMAARSTHAADTLMPEELVGDAASGRAFYLDNCATCHGANGDGNGPRAYFIFPKPRNFLDPVVRRAFNRQALFNGIKHGVTGREMPAWGKVLTDQQIADVTEFVYTAFIRPEQRAADANREPGDTSR